MDDYAFAFTASGSDAGACSDDQLSEVLASDREDIPVPLEDLPTSEGEFELPDASSLGWESSSPSRGSDTGSIYSISESERGEDRSISGESEISDVSASVSRTDTVPVQIPSKRPRFHLEDDLDLDAPKTALDAFMDRLLLGKKASQAASTKSSQTSLFNFYQKETPDERKERLMREALREAEAQEVAQEAERRREERAKEEKRRSARDRQRRSRQRRKDEKKRSENASDLGRSSKVSISWHETSKDAQASDLLTDTAPA